MNLIKLDAPSGGRGPCAGVGLTDVLHLPKRSTWMNFSSASRYASRSESASQCEDTKIAKPGRSAIGRAAAARAASPSPPRCHSYPRSSCFDVGKKIGLTTAAKWW